MRTLFGPSLKAEIAGSTGVGHAETPWPAGAIRIARAAPLRATGGSGRARDCLPTDKHTTYPAGARSPRCANSAPNSTSPTRRSERPPGSEQLNRATPPWVGFYATTQSGLLRRHAEPTHASSAAEWFRGWCPVKCENWRGPRRRRGPGPPAAVIAVCRSDGDVADSRDAHPQPRRPP